MDQNIFLKEGEVAYVMNANGKTISRYEYVVRQQSFQSSSSGMPVFGCVGFPEGAVVEE